MQNSSEITPTFTKLVFIKYPSPISESYIQALKQFVVSLCISAINACKHNVAKRNLFAKRGKTAKNIPPTLDALKQHIKRSAFQVFKGKLCLITDPSLTDSSQWDWQETDSGYFPVWTILQAALTACRILLKCASKKYCIGATYEIVYAEVCACFTFITL